MKAKVAAKIQNWDIRSISRSGKEILIRSVAQTLQTFAINVFLLPVRITNDIARNLTKFWWKTSQHSSSRISWISWDRMTKHKVSGGMGFQSFKDYNLAMLGKQGWRFLINPDSLVTRVYKARYFGDSDFLNANLGNNPIFIWHSILEAKELLTAGLHWQV